MALAGTLYYQLMPQLNTGALAAEAAKGAQVAGKAMGTTMGTEAGKSAAPALAASSRSLETAAATMGTRVGTAIGRPLGTALQPVGTAISWAQSQFERLPPTVRTTMGQIPTVVGASMATMGGHLRTGVTTTARAAHDIADALTTRVGGALATVTGLMANFGISGGLALGAMAGAAIAIGVKFESVKEQATNAFTTMLDDSGKAKDLLAEIIEFARVTPFEVPGLIKSAQQLLAFGFKAESIIPTMTAVGDAVAGLGGSQEILGRVTYALGQIMTRGKVMSSEMLQLTQAGIPAWAILANSMGVSTEELQKMVEKGLVPASTAIPMLLKGIEEGTDGAAGHTAKFAGMMEVQSHTLVGIWSNLKDTFAQTMGNLVAPAIPLLKKGMEGLIGLFQGVPGALAFLGKLFDPLVEGAKILWSVLSPILVPVFTTIRDLLAELGSHLGDVTRFMDENRTAVNLLGAVLVTYVGALWGMKAAMLGVSVATWLTSGAFTALKAVMMGHPIMMIIAVLAALVVAAVYCYENFEWFRNVVNAVWNAIKAAALFAWDILKTVFDSIVSAAKAVGDFFATVWGGVVTAFEAVGAAASWLWDTILKPFFDGVGLAARILIAIIFTILVTPFLIAFNLLRDAALAFWHGAIEPAFEGVKAALGLLGDAFTWLWHNAIEPAWEGIRWAIDKVVQAVLFYWNGWLAFLNNVLIPAVMWFWHNVIEPAWEGIRWAIDKVVQIVLFYWGLIVSFIQNILTPAFMWFWHNVIEPAWEGIRWAIDKVVQAAIFYWNGMVAFIQNVLAPPFLWLWHNVIEPAWNGIRGAIEAAWNFIRDNLFNPLVHFVTVTIPDGFNKAVEFIKAAWDKIKEIAAGPVRFVVNTVWNEGLRKAWNWIAEKVGLPQLDEYRLPFAQGGVVPGKDYGHDTVPAMLRGGEGILVPAATRLVGGAEGIDRLNRLAEAKGYARGGVVDGPFGRRVQHFDEGGIVAPDMDAVTGFFGDINAAVSAVANFNPIQFVKDRFGDLFSGVVGNLENNFQGKVFVGAGRKVVNDTIDMAIRKVTEWWEKAKALLSSMGGPGSAAALEWARTQVGKPYEWAAVGPGSYDCSGFMSAVANVMLGKPNPYSRIGSTGNFPWPGFITGLGPGLNVGSFAGTPGHMAGTINGVNVESAGGVGVRVGGPVGATSPMFGVRAHLPEPMVAAGPFGGLGSAAVQAAVRAAAAIYGWGSGPQWDALNFVISHESGWNPNAQNPTSTAFGLFQFLDATWGAYGAQKTANPAAQAVAGMRYIQQRYGSPLGAQAFWLSHHWYDQGGILPPGASLAYNGTGAPEMVLTPDQFAAVSGSGGPLIGALTVMTPERATAREVVDEMSFALRHTRRGVHGGRRR